MTGRYATHTGIHVPLVDSAPGVLPNDEVLLPALLKEAGYATAMVGKWHCESVNARCLARGSADSRD